MEIVVLEGGEVGGGNMVVVAVVNEVHREETMVVVNWRETTMI